MTPSDIGILKNIGTLSAPPRPAYKSNYKDRDPTCLVRALTTISAVGEYAQPSAIRARDSRRQWISAEALAAGAVLWETLDVMMF